MDNVKESFHKVKKDIDSLKYEIDFLKKNLIETRKIMVEIVEIIKKIIDKSGPTHTTEKQTNIYNHPTHNLSFKALNTQNLGISTGNQGVPTDRQTDKQTDISTHNFVEKTQKTNIIPLDTQQKINIDNATYLLNSLNNIKKEIRLKFKRLTDQEILVFSAIYQLDEERGYSDYKILSEKLGLSESSIRDYVGRLIKKDIPLEKKKINNKTIHLSISQNLKKIASLSNILQLRDL